MLGIQNKYSEAYEAEMAKYRVEMPEYEGDATRNKLGDRELANDKASFFCRSRLLAVFVLI